MWGSRSELHSHCPSPHRFSAELNHSLLSLAKGMTCFEKLPAPGMASPGASQNPGSTSVQSREALHGPTGDTPVGERHYSGLLLPVLALLTAPAAQHREGAPSTTHVTTACGKHSVTLASCEDCCRRRDKVLALFLWLSMALPCPDSEMQPWSGGTPMCHWVDWWPQKEVSSQLW